MFLRKVMRSRFYQNGRTYYVWISYILLIFLFTNAYSSLDLIKSYRFTWDLLLTYGFLAFILNLQALIIAVIIAILQKSLKKLLRFDISTIVPILLIVGLVLALVNLFLMIFDKAIF